MKGLSHFAVGIAAASCLPGAVEAAAAGNPACMLLGGFFGILPDTLDFKFSKFLARHDIEVQPDPLAPDARQIAGAVAHAIDRAGNSGRPCSIKLNTIRLGADRWGQYRVRFDVGEGEVRVEYGPVVNTGRLAVEAGPSGKNTSASAKTSFPIALEYEADNSIDIFDGPTFRMALVEGGRVKVEFIPWHRQWSHSAVPAVLFAVGAAALFGALAGAAALLGYCAHIIADQMGFMGSALLYPFRKGRSPGMGISHSADARLNFGAVWGCCLLILWNLLRANPAAAAAVRFNAVRFFFLFGILPAALFFLLDGIVFGRSPAKEAAGADGRRGKRLRKRP